MSTLTVATVKSNSSSPPVFQNTSSTEIGRLCRAFVHFDGTATPITVRGSFNVSSITDNGTGDYTVNFTTAMPDANYSAFMSVGDIPVPNRVISLYRGFVASGSCRIIVGRPGNASLDEDPIMFGVFR